MALKAIIVIIMAFSALMLLVVCVCVCVRAYGSPDWPRSVMHSCRLAWLQYKI